MSALHPESGLRGVFRYAKQGRLRAYGLKTLSDDTIELWVVAPARRGARKARRLVTFASAEDIDPFLEDIGRELRAGGWSES